MTPPLPPPARLPLWIRPHQPVALPGGVEPTPARVFYDYDRFARELAEAYGAPVDIVERPPEEIPSSEVALVHLDLRLLDHLMEGPGAAARLFLLCTKRAQAMEELDRIAPLGAAPQDSALAWKLGHKLPRGDVWGPRAVAAALGDDFEEQDDLSTSEYALYEKRPRVALPRAVGSYLARVLGWAARPR